MKPNEMRLLGILVVVCACIFVLSILAGGGRSEPRVSLPEGGPKTANRATRDDSLDDWLTRVHHEDQQQHSAEQFDEPDEQEAERDGMDGLADGQHQEETRQEETDTDIPTRVEETEPEELGLRQESEETEADEPAEGTPARSKTYVVKKGDNLWRIADRFYGAAAKWKTILDANRDLINSPEDLRPEMKLVIPPLELSRHEGPMGLEAPSLAGRSLPPGASYYDVQKGDNLWHIAEKRYGSGTAWPKIMKANSDLLSEPEELTPGMRLILP